MSILYLTSTAGAPGVSTLATALTLNWPRPALLLEADIAKTSHILVGYLGGQYEHAYSLTEAAIANMRGELNGEVLFSQTISLGEGRYVIPGFNDIGGARGATNTFWANLARAMGELPVAAVAPDLDIIVDAGRFLPGDPRSPLISQADSVLVVSGNTLPDIAALYSAAPAFDAVLEGSGHADYLGLAITTTPLKGVASYSSSNITAKTGLDFLGSLPWDPATAAHYSHGAHPTGRKSPYHRALGDLITRLDAELAARRYIPVGQD